MSATTGYLTSSLLAQQAKSIPRTEPMWQSDLLYRGNTTGTSYTLCNAVTGAHAFDAGTLGLNVGPDGSGK